MGVFLDYGDFWYEDWQPVQFLKSELYPKGNYADAVSYYFPPGVRADVHLIFQAEQGRANRLGVGQLRDEDVSSADNLDMQWVEWLNTSLTDSPELYVWGEANLGRSGDMLRYGKYVLDPDVPADEAHPNGAYKSEPVFNRMDFGETMDVASGYAAKNNYAMWQIMSAAVLAANHANRVRLPGDVIVHSNLEGAGELVFPTVFMVRVKITQIPANLDKRVGVPEVWRAGRISFGHV